MTGSFEGGHVSGRERDTKASRLYGGGPTLPLWLAFLGACAWLVTQARFTADMSAFLPALATPMQQLLSEQLRDGIAARLILIGIDGGSPDDRARVSAAMARRLQDRPEFTYVANGETHLAQADRDFLFAHRYVLSSAVTQPQHFEQAGLAAALERAYAGLASPLGTLIRRYLPADPTGEFLHVLGAMGSERRPATHAGVWVTPDRRMALALAQTAAPGFDVDAQSRNVALAEQAFAAAAAETGARSAALHMTGPAVFAVRARDAMRSDVRRLSGLGAALIVALLLAAFRSPRLVLLAFVPVATGALAGVAAVAMVFGTVHVITLGFGVALIGEAVDYAIYFFGQRRIDEAPAQSLARIWPTLRLGMLISIASFCAMLFSGLPGLAQLGSFCAVGLVVALATTRYVLPHLSGHAGRAAFAHAPTRLMPRWRFSLPARMVLIGAVFAVAAAVIWSNQPIWDDDLARLNPVSAADQALDQHLRAALGAPDVRSLFVAAAASEDRVLERCESIVEQLGAVVRQGLITGFDAPCAYLPSRTMQAARRQALPGEGRLRTALREAVAASPFRPQFEPFVGAVAAAKNAPPLDRASLRGTALALKVDALLIQRRNTWYALVPLRGAADVAALAQRVRPLLHDGIELLDIKHESTTLLATYRSRALQLWTLGLGLIAALLYFHLRSIARVLVIVAPLGAAVAVTCAFLLAAGTKLALFHLVALLLVVGIGSNYALFFERPAADAVERRSSVFAIVLCAGATIIAFGLLAASRIPVLQMIGVTAALGTALSLALCGLGARVGRTANEAC